MKDFLENLGIIAALAAFVAFVGALFTYIFYSMYGVSVGVQALLAPYFSVHILIAAAFTISTMWMLPRVVMRPVYIVIGIWATHTIWQWSLIWSILMYLGLWAIVVLLATAGGGLFLIALFAEKIRKISTRR